MEGYTMLIQAFTARAVFIPRALLLVSVFPPLATAQPPVEKPGAPQIVRGVLGRGIDPLPAPREVLITMPPVQGEIKLSKAQRERIARLSRENREALDQVMLEYHAKLPPPDQEDPQVRQLMQREMMAAREGIRNRYETAIIEVLQPGQRTRLDQVQLQVEGPIAFLRPEVLDGVNLDPDQIEAIQEIAARGRDQMMATSAVPLGVQPGDGPFTPERYRALSESKRFKAEAERSRTATLKARDATMQAIAKVLSSEQRASYQKMLGEPFDLAKLRGESATDAKQEVKSESTPPSVRRDAK
jgi:hypothetical protein